jgi:hypothetical protein
MTKTHVEETDHQPQFTIQVLGPKRGVNVADIVLVDQRNRTSPLHPSREESALVQLGRLDDTHLR